VLLSQVTVHSSYLLIGIMVAVLGLGIGTAMSPATESIMGSLPLAKAGVGSAVNDTTRQVGGALGVAILGSITNSMYRSSVASSKVISALPASARAAVRNGIGNALGVAQQVPSKVAAAGIAADAKAAFVHAMTSTAVIGAVFALAGAAVALVWLPARPKAEPEVAVEDLAADELEPVLLVD
jgi:hypothetical protein